MQALVFNGQLHLVENYPLPEPLPGEALIRVLYAGICNTDLEILRGYMDFRGVMGHEFVGVVEQCPDPALVGKRIVGEINADCGRCEACAAGRPTHCMERTVLGILGRDGAFAEYLSLPAKRLHLVPEGIEDEAAVFTEPLAAALEIIQQIHIRPTDRVVILGAGKLGSLVAQVLRLVGCELLAIDHHSKKLEILKRMGIKTALEPPSNFLADVVVECTGNSAGIQTARDLLRAQGTLVLKSTYHGSSQINLPRMVVDEITLIGSRCGPFEAALRLLERDLVDVQSLVEAIYPLIEGQIAVDRAAMKGARKVLLQVGNQSSSKGGASG
jgi:threonine dehydrogenase-like Zn-dependent dehydrogenase